jgi:hypothetical protein
MSWTLPCCTGRISSSLLFNSYNVVVLLNRAMDVTHERESFQGERACAARLGSAVGRAVW